MGLLALALGAPSPAAAQTKAGANTPANAVPAKKAPEPKVEGQEVVRGEKGFLGVALVEGNFRITFYDQKKKAMPADVHRALLRWDPKYKPGQERAVLNLTEDGRALTGPKVVRPPHLFKLFITLMGKSDEGADKAVETYTIDFRG